MQTLAAGKRDDAAAPPWTGDGCVGVCVSSRQMTTVIASGNTVLPPPAFVRLLNRLFARLGYFVADNDRLVIIVILLFTIITSAKIAFTRQEDDIKTGYTPFGARSRDEVRVYNEYFAATGEDPISMFLFVTAKNNGSMARYETIKEAVDALEHVGNHITHKNHSFYNLCTDFCNVNEPIRQYLNGLTMGNATSSRITLTFPIMEVLGKELDLSPYFFGVQTYPQTEIIQFVKIVAIQLRANPPPDWKREDVAIYERKMSNYFHKHFQSDDIQVVVMSLTFIGDEIVRTGLTIFPYLALGFTVMSIFSIVTVYLDSAHMNQWTSHKAVQAVFACICPLLATAAALGTLFWLKFRFGTILCVTPFLVLAIGVDDAYLMMHSWMRVVHEDPRSTKRERISRMLVDVGPSITITSLTNVLAFIVGIYTPTPEIQLFCIGNAAAICMDYFFQITIYAAAISITGEYEMKKETKTKVIQWKPIQPEKWSLFLEDYSEWISTKFTAFLVFLIMCGYWYMSIVHSLDIKIILSPDKLVLSDSKLLEVNHLRDHYVLQNYTTVQIFIENPGNFSDPARLSLTDEMVANFESYPECLGSKFSHYFMRDYKSYKEMVEEEEEETEGAFAMTKTSLHGFLSWPEFQHWNGFVKFDEKGHLAKMLVTVSYKGEQLGDFQYRKDMLSRWRRTADSYPELQVSVFDDYAPFVDQLDVILPATLSTSAATLICMMIVCFLFMYNLFTVIVATVSIVSICIGVFGFLSMWNVDLDPISMATTIMSIGFSVDFPAHITFHYFREGLENPLSLPSERVARSLAGIGFPLLQCGISTIIFVLCLLFVDTYMSQVFVKTMVLVVSLGLIHALFLVPVFLCALSSLNLLFFGRRKSSEKPKKTPIVKPCVLKITCDQKEPASS